MERVIFIRDIEADLLCAKCLNICLLFSIPDLFWHICDLEYT